VSHISGQLAHEGGKVVSPTNRPPLPPRNIPGTHSSLWLSGPQIHSTARSRPYVYICVAAIRFSLNIL